jgi:hypothetical protein
VASDTSYDHAKIDELIQKYRSTIAMQVIQRYSPATPNTRTAVGDHPILIAMNSSVKELSQMDEMFKDRLIESSQFPEVLVTLIIGYLRW